MEFTWNKEEANKPYKYFSKKLLLPIVAELPAPAHVGLLCASVLAIMVPFGIASGVASCFGQRL